VRDARPAMREPVRWAANTTLLQAEPGHTLILTDVNALDDAGQQWLLQQLNEPDGADTQVISLSSVPLYSLVETNRFDAALYYRLNTIHLKI
jgi:transcriptional regulator of acetoin/glycerol metabolism